MEMVSGAGHDSCNVSAVAPTAMVFVPCAGGLSHNEAESAAPARFGGRRQCSVARDALDGRASGLRLKRLNDVDCIVIGAGVIGLAAARALSPGGREVIILESERHFGMHTSSRNSEVIHAGIHYEPQFSQSAAVCCRPRSSIPLLRRARHRASALRQVHGRHRASAIGGARENRIERPRQWRLRSRVAGCGARRAVPEPELRCVRALSSPSTGIIDSHVLMQSLLADAEANGASIAYDTRSPRCARRLAASSIAINEEAVPIVRARTVVNCGGASSRPRGRVHPGTFRAQFIPKCILRQGQLFRPVGRLAIFAADLSRAAARRPPRHSHDHRFERGRALRPGLRVGAQPRLCR